MNGKGGEPSDPNPRGTKQEPGAGNRIWPLVVGAISLFILLSTFGQFRPGTSIPYGDFKQFLARGEVQECTVDPGEVYGKILFNETTRTPPAPEVRGMKSGTAFEFRTIRLEDPNLVQELTKAGTKYSGAKPGHEWLSVLLLPLLLLAILFAVFSQRMIAARTAVFSFGKGGNQHLVTENTGVTFKDVAGCDESKLELEEVVTFLRSPARYQEIGATIPKGVLLVGPPGTGKTLLARAVAGEAQVPFFSLSGSDFVEMFVGVGASRVRDLFEQAKSRAPCIVFIDELDAIGRQRGVHLTAGNDEREQTLNQLLVEMDGFEPNAGVILLSATNRPDVLDPALLRPGRFDRQIVLDAPDLNGREAILKVHARKKKLAAEVDLRAVAQGTPGFSGADLANALNEAALLAARLGDKVITQTHLQEAIERVVAGPERKSRLLGTEEKRRVAVHESGHALVSALCGGIDRVRKISIIPRGRAALGYTLRFPESEQFLKTKSELLSQVSSTLAGRAAEEAVFGEVSTGASEDLRAATNLVRQMICLYGMSETIGLTHCGLPDPFLPLTRGASESFQRDCSEETASRIDAEVKLVLEASYQQALATLKAHRQTLDLIATELLQRETLDEHEFYALVQGVTH